MSMERVTQTEQTRPHSTRSPPPTTLSVSNPWAVLAATPGAVSLPPSGSYWKGCRGETTVRPESAPKEDTCKVTFSRDAAGA